LEILLKGAPDFISGGGGLDGLDPALYVYMYDIAQ